MEAPSSQESPSIIITAPHFLQNHARLSGIWNQSFSPHLHTGFSIKFKFSFYYFFSTCKNAAVYEVRQRGAPCCCSSPFGASAEMPRPKWQHQFSFSGSSSGWINVIFVPSHRSCSQYRHVGRCMPLYVLHLQQPHPGATPGISRRSLHLSSIFIDLSASTRTQPEIVHVG